MKFEIGTFGRRFAALAFAAAVALAPLPSLAGTITGGYFPGLPLASVPFTGLEQVPADTNLSGGQSPQTELLNLSNIVTAGRGLYSAATNTTAFTATAVQLEGAQLVVLNLTGALGAGAAITTPTATILLAAKANPYVNEAWRLRIINNSSGNFAWTLTAGTGVTVSGTATIAQNAAREFLCTITSVTAATITCQNIGGMTN